jgi:CXXX repeat radical SAM target protein
MPKKIESKKKSVSKKTETGESGLNRRDFLGIVAKTALPTIAFLSMGRFADLVAKPQKQAGEADSEFSDNPNSCVLTCEGGCRTTCEGECRGTCENGCFLTCEGSCKYDCTGGCNTTCEGGCKGKCGGPCSDGAW